jgi:hypothetical protein
MKRLDRQNLTKESFGQQCMPQNRGLLFLITTSILVFAVTLHANAQGPEVKGSLAGKNSNTSAATGPPGGLEEGQWIDDHHLVRPDKLVDDHASNSEVFAVLHRERRWAIDQTQFFHNRLLAFAAKSHERPVPIPTISESDYNVRLMEIETKIKRAEQVQSDPNAEERQRNVAALDLIDLTRQRARLDLQLEESRAFNQAEADFNKVDQEEAKTQHVLDQTEHYLLSIDNTINRILVTTEKNNNFKFWICAAFAALVGLVIAGFFAITWKENSIKDALLSNDRGLQFVTLFALIIAIILFGVMNILEGRELAALLGGLSGYILGRSNFGHTAEQRS